MESEELKLLREQNQILRVIASALCAMAEPNQDHKAFRWMDQELMLLASFRPDK